MVVGAGVSGVACARALAAAGVPVELRERGYAPGGRMASRTLAGRTVDLGASYLTCRTAEFGAVVGSWSERGLVRPWTDRFAVRTAAGWAESEPGPVRYGTPGGLRSLVEDLATGLDVQVRREVAEVGPGPRVDGDPVAAVVLAMPDPQASDLLADELTDELAAVDGRESEPAFAIAAGWAERCWRDLDGVFVADDADLTWVADDGRRRGDGAPVLVGHTTAAFAGAHLDRPADAAAPALAALRRVLEIDRPPRVVLPAALVAGPPGPAARRPVPPRRVDGRSLWRRLGVAADRDRLDLRPPARPRAGRTPRMSRERE